MVSRIEHDGGNLNWQFARNVMPDEELMIVNSRPDGQREKYSVICRTDDSATCVSEVKDNCVFDEFGLGDSEYKILSIIGPEDLCFITEVYVPKVDKWVKLRISHQEGV